MGDLKRDKDGKKVVQQTRKEVPGNFVKKDQIQVNFGNLERIKLMLYQTMNIHLAEISKTLKDVLQELKKK